LRTADLTLDDEHQGSIARSPAKIPAGLSTWILEAAITDQQDLENQNSFCVAARRRRRLSTRFYRNWLEVDERDAAARFDL